MEGMSITGVEIVLSAFSFDAIISSLEVEIQKMNVFQYPSLSFHHFGSFFGGVAQGLFMIAK